MGYVEPFSLRARELRAMRALHPKQTKQTKQERSQNRAVAKAKLRSVWNHEKNARQAFEELPGYTNIRSEDKIEIAKKIKYCKRDAKADAWSVASCAVLEGNNPLKEVDRYLDHDRNWRSPITERVGNKKTRVRLLCNDAPVNTHKLPSLRWTGRASSIVDDDPHRDTRARDIEWATDSFDGGEQPEPEDFESLKARAETRTPIDDGSDDAKETSHNELDISTPAKMTRTNRAMNHNESETMRNRIGATKRDNAATARLHRNYGDLRASLVGESPLAILLFPTTYDALRKLVAPQPMPESYSDFRKLVEPKFRPLPDNYRDFVELMVVGCPRGKSSANHRVRLRIDEVSPAADTPEPKTQSRKREVNPYLEALIGGKG